MSDQAVSLLGQLAALRLLAAQSSVGLAQLLLQGGVGLWKKGKKKKASVKRTRQRKETTEEIRPDCSAVGSNLGDYSPQVR